jgi:hypothetical protein
MGLDMYAFATRTAPAAPVDFSAGESQELAYWRNIRTSTAGWSTSTAPRAARPKISTA